MSVQISGFTKTTTSPFQDVSGTNYYAGLSGTGATYYNSGNLYIFQQVVVMVHQWVQSQFQKIMMLL